MSLAGLAGWALVGASIAFAICAQKKARCDEAASPDAASRDGGSCAPSADEAWCRAVEAIAGGEALLFDEALCLACAGPKGGRDSGSREQKLRIHMMDLIAQSEGGRFMDGVLAARRGELRSWDCLWRGRRSIATAAAAGEAGVLIWIRDLAI